MQRSLCDDGCHGAFVGDAYNRLLGFRNVLSALAVAMEKLGSERDPVTQAFCRLAAEFRKKFEDFNPRRKQKFK